jgi:hypothetical protein
MANTFTYWLLCAPVVNELPFLARMFHEKPENLCRSGFSRDYGGGFDTGQIRG